MHAPLSDGIEDTHASDDSEHYSDSNGDDGDSAVTGNEDNDDDSNNYSNDDDNEGDERDDDNRDEIDEIEEEDGNDSHDSTDEIDEIDNADIKAPIVDVSIEEAATIVAHALVDAVTRPEIDAAIAATDEIKASDHLLSGMENPPSLPTPLLRDATVDTNTVHDGAADRIESVPLVQNPSVADAIANFKSPTPVHEDKVEESLENANDPGERELTPEEEEKEPIVQEKQYNHFVQRAIDHKRGGQNLGKGEGKPIPTVDVLESLEVEVLEDEYFNVGPKASEEDAIAQKVQAEIDARIYHEIVHKLKPHEINRHNKKHENVASMFPHMFHLLQFAFISFSSTHIGNLFKNWGLPIISGYLFAGMLAGPYILNVLTQPAIMDLRVIDQSSLAVICFAAGAELNFAELRPHLRSILWIMGSLMTCTFCVTFLAVIVLSDWIEFQDGMSASGHLAIAVLISTVLIARSPASAIAIVKDLGADGPFAKICVGVSVAIDVVLIVLFSLNMELSISILHNKAFELASILHPLMSIVW